MSASRSVTLCRSEVHLDFHRWFTDLRLDLRQQDTSNGAQRAADVVGRVAQRGEVWPVDTDRQVGAHGLRGSRQAVLGVSPNTAAEARISLRDGSHRTQGLVVVGVGADGEPDIPGVHIYDLVSCDG